MSVQKIVIVGDKNVDKLSFKNKLMNLNNDDSTKEQQSNNNRFLSWSINGQQLKIEFKIVEPDEIPAVRDSFYRSAQGFICVFDLHDEKSLQMVEKMREQIFCVRSQTRIILVGLKSSKQNQNDKKLQKVSKKEAKRLAKLWKAEYFEIIENDQSNIEKNAAIVNCLNVLMKAIHENCHTRMVSGRKSIKKTLDRFKYYNCFK